jgi:hypothetical protein
VGKKEHSTNEGEEGKRGLEKVAIFGMNINE